MDKIDEDLHDFDYTYLDEDPYSQHPPNLHNGQPKSPPQAKPTRLAPPFQPQQQQQYDEYEQAPTHKHPYADLRPQQPYSEDRVNSMSSTSSSRRLKPILKNAPPSNVNSPPIEKETISAQAASPVEELRDFAAHRFPNQSLRPSGASITSGGNSIKFLNTVETIPHSPKNIDYPAKSEPLREQKPKPATDADLYENAMKVAMAKVYGNRQNEANSLSTPPQSPITQQSSTMPLIGSQGSQGAPDGGVNPNYTYENHHREFAIHSLREGNPGSHSSRKERAKEEKKAQKEEEKRQAELNKAIEKERKKEEKEERKEEKKKEKKPFSALFGRKKRRNSSLSEESSSQPLDVSPEIQQEAERRAQQDIHQKVAENNPVSPVEAGVENPGVLFEANKRARESVEKQGQETKIRDPLTEGSQNPGVLFEANKRAENDVQRKLPDNYGSSAPGGSALAAGGGTIGGGAIAAGSASQASDGVFEAPEQTLSSPREEVIDNTEPVIQQGTLSNASPLEKGAVPPVINERSEYQPTTGFQPTAVSGVETTGTPAVGSQVSEEFTDVGDAKDVNTAGYAADTSAKDSTSPYGIVGTPLGAYGNVDRETPGNLSNQANTYLGEPPQENVHENVATDASLANNGERPARDVSAAAFMSENPAPQEDLVADTGVPSAQAEQTSVYDDDEDEFQDSSSDFVDVPEVPAGAGIEENSKLLSDDGYHVVLKPSATVPTSPADAEQVFSTPDGGVGGSSTFASPAAANVTTPVPRDVAVPDGPSSIERELYEAGYKAALKDQQAGPSKSAPSQTREEQFQTIVAGADGRPQVLSNANSGYSTLDPQKSAERVPGSGALKGGAPNTVDSAESLKSAPLANRQTEPLNQGLGISGYEAQNGVGQEGEIIEEPAQEHSLQKDYNPGEAIITGGNAIPGHEGGVQDQEEFAESAAHPEKVKPKKQRGKKFRKMIDKYFINSYDKQGR